MASRPTSSKRKADVIELEMDQINAEEATTSKGTIYGRAQTAVIHAYYEYDKVTDHSSCLTGKGMCRKLAGKNTTNLKNHLKRHKNAYDEYLKKEAEQKITEEEQKKQERKPKTKAQPEIKSSVSPYAPNHTNYRKFLHSVALFLSRTTCSKNTVLHPAFREMMRSVDPKFPPFGKRTVKNETDKIDKDLMTRMSSLMSEANRFCFTADMWTKNGMEEAFLGVTVHIVHRSTLSYDHLTLAYRCKKNLKHTVPNIVREMASIFDQ